MRTIYRGYAQRVTRTFFLDNVATDLTGLVVTIAKEDGTILVTTGEGTFNELNIIANKVETGVYFVKITPDAAESEGVYLIYWRPTYGAGAAAETWVEGPDIVAIRAEDEIPVLADNYVSLDKVNQLWRKAFDIETPAEILRIGAQASRVLDSELDGRFAVPIQKRKDTGAYDDVLAEAAALITLARILDVKGYKEEAAEFQDNADARIKGINSGRFRLWEEITADEVGFCKPRPSTANAGTNIEIELAPEALFSGDYHRLFVIQVDKAGDIGTATFKISQDGGKTWEATDQETLDTWTEPAGAEGLVFRFFRRGASGNLALGDKWEIEAWPIDTKATVTGRQITTGRALL